jgi:restriction system protein
VVQRNGDGVAHDVLIRSADSVLRAVVVVILLIAYLDWLGRSPIPALLVGGVAAVLVRAWHCVPWAVDDRRETARTDEPRAIQIGDVDLMTCREFQQLVARLMRRDSLIGVRATGLIDDLSTDVVGHTRAGHKVFVQCNRDDSRRRVDTPEIERFLGSASDGHSADIAVLVTTGRFTKSAIALGERRDVVLLDRSGVAAWLTGRTTPLTPYLPATA